MVALDIHCIICSSAYIFFWGCNFTVHTCISLNLSKKKVKTYDDFDDSFCVVHFVIYVKKKYMAMIDRFWHLQAMLLFSLPTCM